MEDVIKGIDKEEFRNLSSLAKIKSFVIFNKVLQNNGVAIGSSLGPIVFLYFYVKMAWKMLSWTWNSFLK